MKQTHSMKPTSRWVFHKKIECWNVLCLDMEDGELNLSMMEMPTATANKVIFVYESICALVDDFVDVISPTSSAIQLEG